MSSLRPKTPLVLSKWFPLITLNPLRTEPFPEIVKFSTKKTSLPKKRGRFDEVKTCPIGARRVVSYSKFNVDYDAHVHLSLTSGKVGNFDDFGMTVIFMAMTYISVIRYAKG